MMLPLADPAVYLLLRVRRQLVVQMIDQDVAIEDMHPVGRLPLWLPIRIVPGPVPFGAHLLDFGIDLVEALPGAPGTARLIEYVLHFLGRGVRLLQHGHQDAVVTSPRKTNPR